jgi:hypothetical protein
MVRFAPEGADPACLGSDRHLRSTKSQKVVLVAKQALLGCIRKLVRSGPQDPFGAKELSQSQRRTSLGARYETHVADRQNHKLSYNLPLR